MEGTLIVAIALCFVAMLAVNVVFRVRVLRAYKELVRAGVEFDASDMLNRARIEGLVQRFPEQERAIRSFTGNIRRSVSLASGLIVLITLLGAVLMYYR